MTMPYFFTILPFTYYPIFVGLHITLMLGIVVEWRREKRTLKKGKLVELCDCLKVLGFPCPENGHFMPKD